VLIFGSMRTPFFSCIFASHGHLRAMSAHACARSRNVPSGITAQTVIVVHASPSDIRGNSRKCGTGKSKTDDEDESGGSHLVSPAPILLMLSGVANCCPTGGGGLVNRLPNGFRCYQGLSKMAGRSSSHTLSRSTRQQFPYRSEPTSRH